LGYFPQIYIKSRYKQVLYVTNYLMRGKKRSRLHNRHAGG
jgi:hypothetical protein